VDEENGLLAGSSVLQFAGQQRWLRVPVAEGHRACSPGRWQLEGQAAQGRSSDAVWVRRGCASSLLESGGCVGWLMPPCERKRKAWRSSGPGYRLLLEAVGGWRLVALTRGSLGGFLRRREYPQLEVVANVKQRLFPIGNGFAPCEFLRPPRGEDREERTMSAVRGCRRSQKTCFLHTCSSVFALGGLKNSQGASRFPSRKQLCFTFADEV